MKKGLGPFKFLLLAAGCVFIRRGEASQRIVPATTACDATRRDVLPIPLLSPPFHPHNMPPVVTERTVQMDRSSTCKQTMPTFEIVSSLASDNAVGRREVHVT